MKPVIDWLKSLHWTRIVAFISAFDMQVTNGTFTLAGAFPEAWIPFIKIWAANGATVLALAVGFTGNPPPIANPVVNKVVAFFAVLLTGLLLFGGDARAQTTTRQTTPRPAVAEPQPDQSTPCPFPIDPLHLCGKLPNAANTNSEENLKAVVARLKAAGSNDLNYALAKANHAATNTSKVRAQCIQGIIDAKNSFDGDVKDASGAVIPRPDPAFVTTVEDVAELVDNLSPQGPLVTACAGTAQMFKLKVLELINALVTGAAGIALLPAGL
jgi:hypothetical protein